MNSVKVPSSKSRFLSWLIIGSCALIIAATAFSPFPLALLPAALIVVVFLLWIWFGTFYELQDEVLLCKSGPFTEKISYEKINSLRLCRNYLSSMAVGRDRIEIIQGKGGLTGTTYISPLDREAFYHALAERCPHLKPKTEDQHDCR